ncbi:tagatose-6-phosphate ketose isomerase, partial [Vibrio anguillarum]|nr:tagatose-6-phosphate ketose isomerase [Vibrio anguillarum]
MNLFLSYEQPWLEQHNGIHTAKEISHQPRLWRALADILEQQYDAVSAFLNPRLA